MKRSILLGVLLASFCSPIVRAELSIDAMIGFADYTTVVRGDAIFAYGSGSNYFQYPGDINTTDFAGGLFLRYLYPITQCFAFGLESGYVYLDQNETRLRSDELPGPREVENFHTKSKGLILLNAVTRFRVAPKTTLGLFAGPAWLNTEYIANDFSDRVVRKVGSSYDLTADVGAEIFWNFLKFWAAGLRFDYIFKTDTRTVAETGSNGSPLLVDNTAKSRLTMVTANVRYRIPGT